MATLDRITQQPDMMGGKACIRGTRVTVGMIVGQIGAGLSVINRMFLCCLTAPENRKFQDILHAVYHRYSHVILHAAICCTAVCKCFYVDQFVIGTYYYH